MGEKQDFERKAESVNVCVCVWREGRGCAQSDILKEGRKASQVSINNSIGYDCKVCVYVCVCGGGRELGGMERDKMQVHKY